ncbi:MAG: tRNA (N6-threonylcarbamoyladenosine(37)-N6)-methyltransferase TrmO [Deltaproteobacteria bacterium]|nr:tRNA (N6-threonylcarbamoyladenosine(37)-N6)-methyltransferase TrmO [Deltaproteobacteria bacterium]
MEISFKPIGFFRTAETRIPRHWSVSDALGRIEIDPVFVEGLKDIRRQDRIIVLFNFHKSSPFTPGHILQTPPHKTIPMGVFSICSPVRPNPIGLSVLTVKDIRENIIEVEHIDMLDKTPVLDIKPYIPPA